MHKLLLKLCIVLSLSLILFVSCDKTDDKITGPDLSPMKIADNVNVVDDSIMSSTGYLPDDSSVLMFDTTQSSALNLKVDDILISSYGKGFLRQITKIDTIDHQFQVATKQANLTDVFSSVNISLDTVLRVSDLDSVKNQISGVTTKATADDFPELYIDEVIYDSDGNLTTKSDQIVLKGKIVIGSSFNFNLNIRNKQLQDITFQNTISENMELTVEVGRALDLIDKQKTLKTYYFNPIVVWAGFVPIVFSPQININVGCKVTVFAKVEVGITQQASVTTGVTYNNGAWHPISEHTFDADPIGPQLTAGCDAKAYAGPDFSLLIYGITGPYVNIHGYGKLEADFFADPWWTLYAGIAAGAGVKMVIFDREIADFGDDEIIGVRRIILQAESSAEGFINGLVKDALTGFPIALSIIKIYDGDEFITSGQTDANGEYRIAVPIGDNYSVEISKAGYQTELYHGVDITAIEDYYLETILQIDEEHSGQGNIAGKIVNALSGVGIDGITIELRSGINNTTDNVIYTTTTAYGGYYSFNNIDAGSYTAEASNADYVTTYFTVTCIGSVTSSNQNASISPILQEGEIRIVLTWGQTPTDLDSHLYGPLEDNTTFHLYYPLAESNNGSPWPSFVTLDRDDVTSYGPETITILQQIPGIYQYHVHDFTNQTSTTSNYMSNSDAQVRVYNGSDLIAYFYIPVNTGGTLWKVFEIDGNNITAINELGFDSPFTTQESMDNRKIKQKD